MVSNADYEKIANLSGDFPVKLIPTSTKSKLPMVFFISGDGGWNKFNILMCETFSEKGMPVVWLNSQKYFWNAKTPEETTLEVSKAITRYLQVCEKEKFILVGYSFGACVAPFVVDRLPGALKESLNGIYCLSPDKTGDFEIHLSDMMSFGASKGAYNVVEGMKKIKSFHPVCFFGDKESTDLTKIFSEAGAKITILPGDHHYNGNASGVAEAIINEVENIKKK